MNYELIYKEDRGFHVKSSFGVISVNDLRFDRNELFWRDRKIIEHMLAWLNENHPEVLL